jgi:hypothetical protein
MSELVPELRVVRVPWARTETPLAVPPRCVACEAPDPSDEVRMTTWAGKRPGAGLTARIAVTYRCCAGCRRKVRWGPTLGLLITLAVMVPLLAIAGVIFVAAPGLPRWVHVVTTGALLLIGAVVSQRLYVAPVDSRGWRYGGIRFDFRHRAYADDFRALNAAG